MKKSEMAKIIRDKVRQIQADEDFFMADAYQLLETIEKAGMLPPECERKLTKKELEEFNTIFAYNTNKSDKLTENDTIFDLCWETEE